MQDYDELRIVPEEQKNFDEERFTFEPKTRGWLRALFYILATFFSPLIINFSLRNISTLENNENATLEVLNIAIIVFISFLVVLLITWVFRRFIDKQKFINLGLELKGFESDFKSGFFSGIVITVIIFSVLYVSNQIKIIDYNFNIGYILVIFILYFVIAINEEIMIRGYVLNNLFDSMRRYIALLVSALIFSLIHFNSLQITFISFINMFLAGILLGTYYIYRKNLWFSIGLHFTWSFMQGPILGFASLGNKTNSILKLDQTGNSILSGGKYGIESSIITTCVIIISILIIHKKYKTKLLIHKDKTKSAAF